MSGTVTNELRQQARSSLSSRCSSPLIGCVAGVASLMRRTCRTGLRPNSTCNHSRVRDLLRPQAMATAHQDQEMIAQAEAAAPGRADEAVDLAFRQVLARSAATHSSAGAAQLSDL